MRLSEALDKLFKGEISSAVSEDGNHIARLDEKRKYVQYSREGGIVRTYTTGDMWEMEWSPVYAPRWTLVGIQRDGEPLLFRNMTIEQVQEKYPNVHTLAVLSSDGTLSTVWTREHNFRNSIVTDVKTGMTYRTEIELIGNEIVTHISAIDPRTDVRELLFTHRMSKPFREEGV